MKNSVKKVALFLSLIVTSSLLQTFTAEFAASVPISYLNPGCIASLSGAGLVIQNDSSSSGRCTMQIRSNSIFTVPDEVTTVSLVVVGGGGAGGGYAFGGGGGGGLVVVANNVSVRGGDTYTVTLGAGGRGANPGWFAGGSAQNGGDTSFGSLIVASGGGGGANYDSNVNTSGGSGGSGGGGGEGASTGGIKAGGASNSSSYSGIGTAYGNNGGSGYAYTGGVGGGGGGAHVPAGDASFRVGSKGGDGISVRTLLTTGTWDVRLGGSWFGAGGGGGSGHCCDSVPGTGGFGGGGIGGDWRTNGNRYIHATGYGNGGGGAGSNPVGGNGSGGMVYITFAAPPWPYNITFNANGGSGTQAGLIYKDGGSPTVLPTTTTFTKTGHSFVGWAASAGSTSTGLSYNRSRDATLYAVWAKNSYSVTFNKNSDTATGTMAIETRSATTALPANAFTWDANNTFQGWNTATDGSGTSYTNGQSYPYVASTTLYAQWGKTISYSSAGADSGLPSRSSDSWNSGAISLPTVGTMVKAGYSFGGWSNGVTNYTDTYTPTTGITLNPVWAPYTYTISFNKNGVLASGAVPSNQTWIESTTALTLSGNTGSMVRTGYSFGGWATSADSQTAFTTFASTSNTLTQTLYAIWTPVSYSATYALDGGTSTLPTEANKNINNTFTVAAAATRDGYVFGGWSDGTSIYSAGSTYTVGAASITLTAQWIASYTVHYVMNGSLTTPTADTTTASGTIVALASAPSRTGYTFAGWVDNLPTPVTHAAGSNFSVIQDSTLQASWTPVAYTVTYALASGTSTLPTQASQNINNTFTIASTPTRAGYLFTGWSDGTNTYGAGASYVVGSSPITLTATWSAISYTVTYDLAGGTGTLPTKSNVNIGNTFVVSTLTNPTWLAHTFLGWRDGIFTYAKTDTYNVGASNIVLTAAWRQNGYTQITYASGGGSGTLPTQVALIEGSEFNLASSGSITKGSYAFSGWSDGTDTFTVGTTYFVGPDTSPITLTAQWGTGYSVTYLSDTGTGSVPIDATYRAENTVFSLSSGNTLSKSGYTFAGWSDGTSTYAAGTDYTFGSSDITLTAIWTAVVAISGGSGGGTDSVVTKEKEKSKDVVVVITRETKSTESIIVDAGVKAIKDFKRFDSYFKTPVAPTTPVIKPIGDKIIVVISTEISVNPEGVNATSDKPVIVPITLTNPIITDEVAKALSSKITVENNESNLKITAVNGFTGIVIVPVFATVNGVQTAVLNRVVVSPAPPIAKGFAPVDIGKSIVDWKASTSQVVSYEVAVNGKVACTTTTTTCPLTSLIGPNTKVTVNAIGNDQTKSAAQVVPYTAVKPIPALKLNFGKGSTALTTLQKSEIRSIAKVINTQGFTRLVVNGFTDATGSPAVNAALSKARATSVVNFMKTLLPKVSIKAGANGAAKPIANNGTDDGRAQNRRTEIATW